METEWQRADRSAGSGSKAIHWRLTTASGWRVGTDPLLLLVASGVSTANTCPAACRSSTWLATTAPHISLHPMSDWRNHQQSVPDSACIADRSIRCKEPGVHGRAISITHRTSETTKEHHSRTKWSKSNAFISPELSLPKHRDSIHDINWD